MSNKPDDFSFDDFGDFSNDDSPELDFGGFESFDDDVPAIEEEQAPTKAESSYRTRVLELLLGRIAGWGQAVRRLNRRLLLVWGSLILLITILLLFLNISSGIIFAVIASLIGLPIAYNTLSSVIDFSRVIRFIGQPDTLKIALLFVFWSVLIGLEGLSTGEILVVAVSGLIITVIYVLRTRPVLRWTAVVGYITITITLILRLDDVAVTTITILSNVSHPGVFAMTSLLVGIALIGSVFEIRHGRAQIFEERLGRYVNLSQYIDTGMIAFEAENESSRTTGITTKLEKTISNLRFGQHTRKWLNQADLKLTPVELAVVHIFFVGLGVAAANYVVPGNLLAATLFGLLGYLIPDVYIYSRARDRIHRFEQQFPYALDLWISYLASGYTIARSVDALANIPLRYISSEFHRLRTELMIGISLDEALEHFRARIPSRDLRLVLEAIYIQRVNNGPLEEMLKDVRDSLQKIKQIRTRYGYLATFHDLLFPLIVVLLLLNWVIVPSYFAPLWQSFNGLTLYFAATVALSIVLIIASTSGKQLKRIERLYQLPKFRNSTMSMPIGLLRIASIAFFVAIHFSGTPLFALAWAWLMLFCLETPFALISIFVGTIVVASQLRVSDMPFALLIPDVTISTPISVIAPIGVIILGILLIVLSGAVIALWQSNRGIDPVQRRLAEYSDRERIPPLDELETSVPMVSRWIAPLFRWIGQSLSQWSPATQLEILQKTINQAGLGFRLSPSQFAAGRVLLILLFSGVVYYVTGSVAHWDISSIVLLILLAAIGGYWLPWVQLQQLIRKRRRTIRSELPEILLLLELWARGRVGIETAMAQIYNRWESQLGTLFGLIAQQRKLGKDLDAALSDIAAELEIDEVDYVAASVIQNQRDGFLDAIVALRSHIAMNQERLIRESLAAPQFWHPFAIRTVLVIALVVWMLLPLLAR